MAQYLMIENEGTTDIEALTLMGVSTSRGNNNLIGKFGTGSKKGITLLLRNNVPVFTFIGNLRAEYYTEPIVINGQSFNQVCVKLSGSLDGKLVNRKEKLGWVLEDGCIDWNDTSMALREFVSNAIDASYGDASKINIEIVEENKVRVRNGGTHTRIFVEATEKVKDFHNKLHKHFLHFTKQEHEKIIQNSPPTRVDLFKLGPEIYYSGVYLTTLNGDKEQRTLFSYNFEKQDLKVGESRTVSADSLVESISNILIKMDAKYIRQLIDTFIFGAKTWESENFNRYYVTPKTIDENKAKWLSVWKQATTEQYVLVPNSTPESTLQSIENKGYIPVVVTTLWFTVLELMGLPTHKSLLSYAETQGYKLQTDVPESLEQTVSTIWDNLKDFWRGKDKPLVKVFACEHTYSKVLGLQHEDTIFINNDLITDGTPSTLLKQVILEEIGHYITGAKDNCRDFQNFFIEVISKTLLVNV